MVDDTKALLQRMADRASETQRLAEEAIRTAFSARAAYLDAAMDFERVSGRGTSKFFRELQAQWRFVTFSGRPAALRSLSLHLLANRFDRLLYSLIGR